MNIKSFKYILKTNHKHIKRWPKWLKVMNTKKIAALTFLTLFLGIGLSDELITKRILKQGKLWIHLKDKGNKWTEVYSIKEGRIELDLKLKGHTEPLEESIGYITIGTNIWKWPDNGTNIWYIPTPIINRQIITESNTLRTNVNWP